MVLCGGLSAGDNIGIGARDCERFNALHPRISYIPGLHSEYLADEKLLGEMGELIHGVKKPFFAHNSETAREVRECVERHGLTPTGVFEKYGLFDYGGGGFHCVHFTDADMEIFRRRGLWAVSCPGSNAKLASGIAPIVEFQRRGIRLALGTDGSSSNNALNMFREMYLCTVLAKLREQDAAVCDGADVLAMACRGGAGAMGLADCDSIAVGKRADLVVMDLREPNMSPEHNLVKNLVYSGSNRNVRLTMVDWKVLYEDGEYFVGESREDILRHAREATEKMLAQN
jgi:5-methylthioadenosine/S-adenosylhomocysteine deaminase